MRINKSLLLWIAVILPFCCFSQTGKLSGMLKDENQKPVAGATITITSTRQSTTTDANGNYSFSGLNFGPYHLEISVNGQSKTGMDVNVDQAEKHVDLAFENNESEPATINQDSQPVISLGDEEIKEASSTNVASSLSASRDAFISASTFVFSAARFRVRGYDDDQSVTLMNGVPMNDLTNGRTLYSSWSGLNDVMRSRENSIGLAPVTYSFGEIGGINSIDSRSSHQRKQFQVSYAVSNRTYDNRVALTYGSGVMANNWSYTISYSRRWANEGYVKGTFYDGHSYFASVEKIINTKHSLALTVFGAPTKNGRSGPATQEMFNLAGTHYYNPDWGYQNGKVRNSVIGDSHQPVAILTHEWKTNDRSTLETSVAVQAGKYKVSGLDWYNASNPHPDYYRNMPSFDPNYGDDPASYAVYSSQVADLLRNNENLRQIQWDNLYEANLLHDSTINGVSGLWAKYIVADRVIDSKRLTFNTTYNTVLSDHVVFDGGLSYQKQTSEFYHEVKDLLGADFYVDLDQFADLSNPTDTINIQNDLNNPNRILHVGDKYGYDYEAHVNRGEVWGQIVMKFDRFDYYASVNVSNTRFFRKGLFRNGAFPNNSFGDSRKYDFYNGGVKGGITYKLNGRNYFFVNAAWETKPPFFDDAFVSPRTRNSTAGDLADQTIYTTEGGYLFRAPRVKIRAVGYFTQLQDITDTRRFYDEDYKTFVNYTLTGMDKRHVGTELSIEGNVGKGLSLHAVAAIGQFFYSNRPHATTTQDNKDTLLSENEEIYINGLRLATGPQSAYTFGITYRSPHFWTVYVNFNYYANTYVDINPRRRTLSSLDLVDNDVNKWNDILSQEKLPGQYTMDMSASWSWKVNNKFKSLKKNTFLVLNLGVTNLLNNQDILNFGYEYARFDTQNKDINKYPNKYSYAFGTTFFANVALRFN